MSSRDQTPSEIADDVYGLRLGLVAGNVYFLRSGSSWVLVDTAFAGRDRVIRGAAEALFGAGARPEAILLTHVHPDHSGSALALARAWGCPVYVHPDEMPLAVLRTLDTVKRFANPLDHWLVLPLLRLLPRRRVQAMLARESLEGVVQALEPDAAVPGLPAWRSITTAGHSPGHVVFFRDSDRVLISGDALVTADLGSVGGLLGWILRPSRPRIAGPPWYTNWDRAKVRASAAALVRLRPQALASGHGPALAGDAASRAFAAFARRHGLT